ncbi:spidroin 4A variant 1 [Trichonephila inaurata madagascariensis]|uniref:Spidroin 4A variant 1 n=1 Tax=Trichonephila inaurata madagascariensis TaxID=2747483 RepID=A0A8X6JXV8_9ARAC|nr:spidroin 4A variant 1 [Trichonephila inaurata madagascariensis]
MGWLSHVPLLICFIGIYFQTVHSYPGQDSTNQSASVQSSQTNGTRGYQSNLQQDSGRLSQNQNNPDDKSGQSPSQNNPQQKSNGQNPNQRNEHHRFHGPDSSERYSPQESNGQNLNERHVHHHFYRPDSNEKHPHQESDGQDPNQRNEHHHFYRPDSNERYPHQESDEQNPNQRHGHHHFYRPDSNERHSSQEPRAKKPKTREKHHHFFGPNPNERHSSQESDEPNPNQGNEHHHFFGPNPNERYPSQESDGQTPKHKSDGQTPNHSNEHHHFYGPNPNERFPSQESDGQTPNHSDEHHHFYGPNPNESNEHHHFYGPNPNERFPSQESDGQTPNHRNEHHHFYGPNPNERFPSQESDGQNTNQSYKYQVFYGSEPYELYSSHSSHHLALPGHEETNGFVSNNPLGFNSIGDKFAKEFVTAVIENPKFGKGAETDFTEVTFALTNAINLLRTAFNAPREQKRTIMIAFAATISELIVIECRDNLTIEEKVGIISNALKIAYLKTTGHINYSLITEVSYLVIIFLGETRSKPSIDIRRLFPGFPGLIFLPKLFQPRFTFDVRLIRYMYGHPKQFGFNIPETDGIPEEEVPGQNYTVYFPFLKRFLQEEENLYPLYPYQNISEGAYQLLFPELYELRPHERREYLYKYGKYGFQPGKNPYDVVLHRHPGKKKGHYNVRHHIRRFKRPHRKHRESEPENISVISSEENTEGTTIQPITEKSTQEMMTKIVTDSSGRTTVVNAPVIPIISESTTTEIRTEIVTDSNGDTTKVNVPVKTTPNMPERTMSEMRTEIVTDSSGRTKKINVPVKTSTPTTTTSEMMTEIVTDSYGRTTKVTVPVRTVNPNTSERTTPEMMTEIVMDSSGRTTKINIPVRTTIPFNDQGTSPTGTGISAKTAKETKTSQELLKTTTYHTNEKGQEITNPSNQKQLTITPTQKPKFTNMVTNVFNMNTTIETTRKNTEGMKTPFEYSHITFTSENTATARHYGTTSPSDMATKELSVNLETLFGRNPPDSFQIHVKISHDSRGKEYLKIYIPFRNIHRDIHISYKKFIHFLRNIYIDISM